MIKHQNTNIFIILLLGISSNLPSANCFTYSPLSPQTHTATAKIIRPSGATASIKSQRTSSLISVQHQYARPSKEITQLYAGEDSEGSSSLGESEQTILGVAGFVASVIMLYSESVLFQTGCGLPAGPFGLLGAAEGVSYLGVVGLVGYSLFTKIKTGSGLPAGPGGILGAAEGVAYLAVLAGVLVLIAQVANYGYIPNAVPMEGGMCQ